jgi:hypothetical protein
MACEERQHAALRLGACGRVVCIVTDESVASADVGLQRRSRPLADQNALDGERIGELGSRQQIARVAPSIMVFHGPVWWSVNPSVR